MNTHKAERGIQNKSRIWFRFLNISIKIIILLGLLFLIYSHLNGEKGILFLWDSMKQDIIISNSYLLLIAVLLIPMNWILESYKWRSLTQPFENISFSTSIKSILCGITLAIITPNRIGEYGGRIVSLQLVNKAKGLAANFIGSISQNYMNVCFGFLGAIYFYDHLYGLGAWPKSSLLFLWVLISTLLAIIYFNLVLIQAIIKKFSRFSLAKKIYDNIKFIKSYSFLALSKILGISFLRYIIYVTQFILILKFFGISPPMMVMIMGVTSIYFIQTGVPLPPLLGILARGEIALLVWSSFAFNELSILAATYTLWILNLVLPALIGLIILLKTNLTTSFGYGSERV